MAKHYNYPIAISRLGDEDTKEEQVLRAVKWLLFQQGEHITIVTPYKEVDYEIMLQLINKPNVIHYTFSNAKHRNYSGKVLLAWPDIDIIDNLWDQDIDALSLIENEELPELIPIAKPTFLYPDKTVESNNNHDYTTGILPDNISIILSHLADMSKAYSNGLKWNEIEMLKSELNKNPARFSKVTSDEIKTECLYLGMRISDARKITELIEEKKQGKQFRVKPCYKDFEFNV